MLCITEIYSNLIPQVCLRECSHNPIGHSCLLYEFCLYRLFYDISCFSDVGSHYQGKPTTGREQQVDTRPRRSQTAKSREKLSYDLFNNEFENRGQTEQIHAKGINVQDSLVITDLTVDETESTFSTLEKKYLLR